MQGIYLGYMYSRSRKIRGLDKNDPVENKVQMHHHSKSLRRKSGRNQKNYPLFKNVQNGEGVIASQAT